MMNSTRLALLAVLLVLAASFSPVAANNKKYPECDEDDSKEGDEGCGCEAAIGGASSFAQTAGSTDSPSSSTTQSSTTTSCVTGSTGSTGSSSTGSTGSTGSSSTGSTGSTGSTDSSSTGSSSTGSTGSTGSTPSSDCTSTSTEAVSNTTQLENGLEQIKTTSQLTQSEQVTFDECISEVRYCFTIKKTMTIKKFISLVGYKLKKWCKKNKQLCKKIKYKKLFGNISFKKFCAVGERYFAKYQYKNLLTFDSAGNNNFTASIDQSIDSKCGAAAGAIFKPINLKLKKRINKELVGKGKAKFNQKLAWLLKGYKKLTFKKLSAVDAQCVLDMVNPACDCTNDQILTFLRQIELITASKDKLFSGGSNSKVNKALSDAVANATASGSNSTSNATLQEVSNLSNQTNAFADANTDTEARISNFSASYDKCSDKCKEFVNQVQVTSDLDNNEEECDYEDLVPLSKSLFSFANLTGQGVSFDISEAVSGIETVIRDVLGGSDCIDAMYDYQTRSQDASVFTAINNCKKCCDDAVLPKPNPAVTYPPTSSGRFDCVMYFMYDYKTRALKNRPVEKDLFKKTEIPTKFRETPETCEFINLDQISEPTCDCKDK